MGYIVRMPQLGMSMDQGEVVEWRVDEGGSVEEGDVVAVVESEKASAEIDARESGVLLELLVPEDEVAEPGAAIGIVGDPDEDPADYHGDLDAEPGDDGHPPAGDTPESTSPGRDAGGSGTGAEPGTSGSRERGSDGRESVRATPGARKLAQEQGVELAAVEGTGPNGVVTEDDVSNAGTAGAADGPDGDTAGSDDDVRATPGAKQLADETGVALAGVEGTGPEGVVTEDDVEAAGESDPGGLPVRERRELSGIQQSISDRLSESDRNAVHVTLNRTFDTARLDAVVDAADTVGMDVAYTDLLIKAVAEALGEHPALNAHYEDGEHVLYDSQNVGFAVDVEAGLVTPVLTDVSGKSVTAVNDERRALTETVQSGAFTMDDLSGGTFTVSNLGMFGVDHFDPVINPPEVAILGVGRRRPDATMTLSLSFDHRVVNGADAARFLHTLVELLTDSTALERYFH